METLSGFQHKFTYSIQGHSGKDIQKKKKNLVLLSIQSNLFWLNWRSILILILLINYMKWYYINILYDIRGFLFYSFGWLRWSPKDYQREIQNIGEDIRPLSILLVSIYKLYSISAVIIHFLSTPYRLYYYCYDYYYCCCSQQERRFYFGSNWISRSKRRETRGRWTLCICY